MKTFNYDNIVQEAILKVSDALAQTAEAWVSNVSLSTHSALIEGKLESGKSFYVSVVVTLETDVADIIAITPTGTRITWGHLMSGDDIKGA